MAMIYRYKDNEDIVIYMYIQKQILLGYSEAVISRM